MGAKAAEMLRLIPETPVAVIERCSRPWRHLGRAQENFEMAVKVGKPGARQAAIKNDTSFVASECPLAGEHLMQVMEMTAGEQTPKPSRADHPIELFARAYGLLTVTSHDCRRADRPVRHPAARPSTRKLRAERRRQICRDQEEPPARSRARSRPSISRSTTPCCTRCRRCCFIEKGGAAQIPDELAAYNPLIPQGCELVATVMFEIDDPVRRARVLATLGGVEDQAFIRVGGEMIRGVPEGDQERTRDDGKASSVQFIRFPFTAAQIAAFRGGAGDVVVGFDHPNYGHMAVMPPAVRQALSADFS